MATTTNAGKFFTVPAGTPATKCRGPSCGARIYFIRRNGVPMPIDCDCEGGKRPSESKDKDQGDIFGVETRVFDGKGVSHFATCPDAELFRRRDQ